MMDKFVEHLKIYLGSKDVILIGRHLSDNDSCPNRNSAQFGQQSLSDKCADRRLLSEFGSHLYFTLQVAP